MIKSDANWQVDYFNTTVDMSTYLVAFVISDFKLINDISPKSGVLVEVAARPEAIDNGDGDYALGEAMEIIDFFADYFDVPYPLKKSSNNLI